MGYCDTNCEKCEHRGERCLKLPKAPKRCHPPCHENVCIRGCGTAYMTNFANDAFGLANDTATTVQGGKAVNIGHDNGNVCFAINFLDKLPAGALPGQSSLTIAPPSSAPTLACGEIEVCCGWYQYTVANNACELFRKASLLVLIEAIENLGGVSPQDPSVKALVDAFSGFRTFIDSNLGYYKLSRHVKSQTAQIWLSNLPSVAPPSLDNVHLINFTSGYANLVLDGVYKQCKGRGGRRYTGALNGSQLDIFNAAVSPNASEAVPIYPEFTSYPVLSPPGSNSLFQATNSRSFGTISINVVFPRSN